MSAAVERRRPGAARLLRRRVVASILCATAAVLLYAMHSAWSLTLAHPMLVTGWVLLPAVLLLTLYNLRKKVDFLPAFASSTWLQIHLYLGYFSIVAFALHVGLRRPSGLLESVLYACFAGAAFSGVFGIYVTRLVPPRLANRGEEVIFERIPALIRRLRAEVQDLVLVAAREVDSTALPDLYLRSLHDFFSGPRNRWAHLRESRGPLRRLLREFEDLERFLGSEEKQTLARLGECVRAKDDLDYHYVHQALLKYWLFVHIPLAYGAALLGVLHVALVYAYGGVR